MDKQLNQVIVNEYMREDGSVAVEYDYQYCPSQTDQTQAHMSDLNYLVAKYKPDELAAYMAARNSYRQEVLGHDFSVEPSHMEAKNIIKNAEDLINRLPAHIRDSFRSPLDFVKFVDNPQNTEILVKSGLANLKEIQKITGPISEPQQQQKPAEPAKP